MYKICENLDYSEKQKFLAHKYYYFFFKLTLKLCLINTLTAIFPRKISFVISKEFNLFANILIVPHLYFFQN